jgi:carbonic anhydrase
MCMLCRTATTAHLAPASRRHFLKSLALASLGVATIGSAGGLSATHRAWADALATPPKPQNMVSSDAALALLQKGNARYVEGVSKRHDFKHERDALTKGQNPYAGILSCADSRIAPEYAFDSGRGDLFVCRVAGNFANDDTIASFEYAVANLGMPLILVLGHEKCGAVDATLKSIKDKTTLPGHLPALVTALRDAATAGAAMPGDALANAIQQNVIDTVARLKAASPIISTAVDQQKVKIVGGLYRLATGKVDLVA